MNYKDPILLSLVSLIVHSHFRSISIGEALAVGFLCAAHAYQLYLNSQKEEPINEAVKKELGDLRSMVNALKIGRAFGK